MKMFAQQLNEGLFQILECGDIALSQHIQKAFMMMGMTKTGKTTLGHFLSNEPLRGYKQRGGEMMLATTTKNYQNAIIGASNNSQTQIPNYFYPKIKLQNSQLIEKLTLIDCAGFGDSYGVHRILSNAYFNYRVFSKVQKIKFILVFKQTDLTGTASGLVKTIKGFFDNFNNWKQVKAEVLNATSFVVSKATRELPEILASLEKLSRDLKSSELSRDQMKYFQDIIMNMIQNKKVHMFKLAQENVITPISNTLLREIDAHTQFWERKYLKDQQSVDMSPISFIIFKQIQSRLHKPDSSQDWSSLMKFFNEKTSYMIKTGLKEVLQTIIEDSCSSNEQSCNCFEKMSKVIKSYGEYKKQYKKQYQSQRNLLKKRLFQLSLQEKSLSTNSQIFWIKKFQIVGQINRELCSAQKQLTSNDKPYKWIKDRTNSINKLVRSFNRLAKSNNKSNQNLVLNYGYEMFRVFQECKLFFLLLNGPNLSKTQIHKQFLLDIHQTLQEVISGTFGHPLIKLKRQFALNHSILKDLNAQKYSQILKFYQQMNQEIDRESQREIDRESQRETDGKSHMEKDRELEREKDADQKTKLKLKEIELAIYSSERVLQNGDPGKKMQSIKQLNGYRKNIEKDLIQNPEDSKSYQEKRFLIIQIMSNMGNLLTELKMERQAISCFNSIKFIPNALQAYSKMAQRSKDRSEKRKVYIQWAQYADKNCRQDIAMAKLQEAYTLSMNFVQYKEIQSLIVKQSVGDSKGVSAYKKDMLNQILYRELLQEEQNRLQQALMDLNELIGSSFISKNHT